MIKLIIFQYFNLCVVAFMALILILTLKSDKKDISNGKFVRKNKKSKNTKCS